MTEPQSAMPPVDPIRSSSAEQAARADGRNFRDHRKRQWAAALSVGVRLAGDAARLLSSRRASDRRGAARGAEPLSCRLLAGIRACGCWGSAASGRSLYQRPYVADSATGQTAQSGGVRRGLCLAEHPRAASGATPRTVGFAGRSSGLDIA